MISIVKADSPVVEAYLKSHSEDFGGLEFDNRDHPDYVFQEYGHITDGWERKTIKDLIASLRDGRLERQLQDCARDYQQVGLLIEGVLHCSRNGDAYCNNDVFRPLPMTYNNVQALIDRVGSYGIHIRHTADELCTARTLIAIYNSRLVPPDKRGLFTRIIPCVPYRDHDPRVEALVRLRIPGIGPVRAKAIVNQIGGIPKIVNCKDSELQKVIGKDLTKNVRKVL